MALTDRHPINVAELYKGQTLTIPELELIVAVKATDQTKFELRVLGLSKYIESKTDFTVCQQNGCLRILTDAEASVYNHKRFQSGFHVMQERVQKNGLVDTTALTPEQLRLHNARFINETRILGAAKAAARSKRIAMPAGQKRLNGAPDGEDAGS